MNLSGITIALKSIGEFAGDNYSLFLIFPLFWGIYFLLINKKNNKIKHISLFIINLMFFLGISIVYENKYIPYHFSRLYIPLSILIGFGLYDIINQTLLVLKKLGFYERLICLILIITLLILSPLPRTINQFRLPYFYFKNSSKYTEQFSNFSNITNIDLFVKETADYLNPRIKSTEKVLIIATGVSTMRSKINSDNFSKFGQSCYYLSSYSPKVWKDDFKNELLNSNWLVVNTNDSQPIIFNNNRSSFESINFNIDFRDILNTRYDFLQSYGAFRIYHQKAINNNSKS